MVSCKRLEYGIHEFSLRSDCTAAGHPGLLAIGEGEYYPASAPGYSLEIRTSARETTIPVPFLCSRNVSLQYPPARQQNGADQDKSHCQYCTLPRREYNKAHPEHQEQYQHRGNAQPNQDEQSSDHFHPPIHFRFHLCPFNCRLTPGTDGYEHRARASARRAPRPGFCALTPVQRGAVESELIRLPTARVSKPNAG